MFKCTYVCIRYQQNRLQPFLVHLFCTIGRKLTYVLIQYTQTSHSIEQYTASSFILEFYSQPYFGLYVLLFAFFFSAMLWFLLPIHRELLWLFFCSLHSFILLRVFAHIKLFRVYKNFIISNFAHRFHWNFMMRMSFEGIQTIPIDIHKQASFYWLFVSRFWLVARHGTHPLFLMNCLFVCILRISNIFSWFQIQSIKNSDDWAFNTVFCFNICRYDCILVQTN